MTVCLMVSLLIQPPIQLKAQVATITLCKQRRVHIQAGHTYEIMTLDRTSKLALRFKIIVFLED